MAGQIDFFGLTDIGKKREHNEDQFLIADLSKSMRVHQTSLGLDHQTRLFGASQGKLLLVADGMGVHASGERASTIAVDVVTAYVLDTLPWFYRLDHECEDDFIEELKQSVRAAQDRIQQEANAMPKRRGMGTTLTMAYIIWPRMYVLNAGDSRCYLHRDGELRQLTRDHTVAEQFREANGGTTFEPSSRWSNVLWNVVGGAVDDLTVEARFVELKMGDSVLLCTDGLNHHVSDDEIAAACRSDQTAERLCRGLVDQALAAGGKDNVTVVAARFLDEPNDGAGRAAAEETVHAELVESKSLRDTDPYLPSIDGAAAPS